MKHNYEVVRLGKSVWLKELSEKAHFSTFGMMRPKESERVDFALLVSQDLDPMGYVSCIEMDSETLYWQQGGIFKHKQKSFGVYPSTRAIFNWSLKNYQYVQCRVTNQNLAMLHLGMKLGFRIVGTRCSNGILYCELQAQREGEIQ